MNSKLIVGIIIIYVIVLTACSFLSSCAIFQPKPKQDLVPTTAPNPAVQLWLTVKKSNWLVTMAIPVIALGAVAMFNGAAKLGMSAIIFGCVNLFMALATARFALWMSIFGLIGSVAAVVASILSKNRGLREIVCGIQEIKDTAKEDNVDLVFQDKMKGILSKQVKSTKKLVKKIKGKI